MRKTLTSLVASTILILILMANFGIICDVTSNVKAEDVWAGGLRLSDWGNGSLQPQVAAYGDYIHVVWSDNKSGNFDIYYRRSTDNGTTWDPEVKLSDNSTNKTHPKIAVWENNIHVIWKNGYVNSTDNGETWKTPSNPFGDMTLEFIDIRVRQNNVYLAVINESYRFSNPPWFEEWWKYVLFKELSWLDWAIVDTETEYDIYFADLGLAVINDNIHIVYGKGHHVTMDSVYHSNSTSAGSPGSWSTPEWIGGTAHSVMGISSNNDGDTVRMAWCNSDSMGEGLGVFTKVWNGSWSDHVDLGGAVWGHTSVAGNYVTWDYSDVERIENNIDGEVVTTSFRDNEIWHDTYLDNGNVHLVYIDENEIYYMGKNNWPDLGLNGEIEFLPSSIVEVESTVQINALIDNTGFALSGVLVRFYLGNPDSDFDGIPDPSAVIIGNDTIDIGEGASEMATINWTPPSVNFYEIYVWIDPDNEIIERDDANNLHMNLLQVVSKKPLPPSNLVARLSPVDITDVELIWNRSLDDGSGENDVQAYGIYKSTSGVNGSYSYITMVWADGSSSYSWLDIDAGDGDFSDYFYFVRAYDGEIESQNSNKAGKTAIPLEQGWNVVSVPLNQMVSSINIAFQNIAMNYSTVQSYHAGRSDPWVHWHEDKPNYLNDEISINIDEGYYIKMKYAETLIVLGAVPTDIPVSLKAGWNLIGYPSLNSHNRTEGLNNLLIATQINKIQCFNSTTQKWNDMEEGDYFEVGSGYWIHATQDCVWEVPL